MPDFRDVTEILEEASGAGTAASSISIGTATAAKRGLLGFGGMDAAGQAALLRLLITNPSWAEIGAVVRPLPFWPATFQIYAAAVPMALNKSMLSVLNTEAAKIMRLHRIRIYNTRVGGGVGATGDFGLRRISAHLLGTELTTTATASGIIQSADPSADTLPTGVTARTGATVTETNLFNTHRWLIDSDTFDSSSPGDGLHQLVAAYETQTFCKPLTFRQNQGFHVINTTAAATGVFDLSVVITLGAA